MRKPTTSPAVSGRTTLHRPSRRSGRPSGAGRAGPLHGDLDAPVLRPALRRVVRGYRMRVAEPLGRDDVRVDALRHQVGDDVAGAPRRQGQIVVDPGPLQWRSDRQIVGVAVDDDLSVLQPSELGDDIVAELRLAGGAELIAAL